MYGIMQENTHSNPYIHSTTVLCDMHNDDVTCTTLGMATSRPAAAQEGSSLQIVLPYEDKASNGRQEPPLI